MSGAVLAQTETSWPFSPPLVFVSDGTGEVVRLQLIPSASEREAGLAAVHTSDPCPSSSPPRSGNLRHSAFETLAGGPARRCEPVHRGKRGPGEGKGARPAEPHLAPFLLAQLHSLLYTAVSRHRLWSGCWAQCGSAKTSQPRL